MKNIDWAYIAGFIDADGSVAIEQHSNANGTPRYAVKLYITNADRDIMDWLVANLHGSVYLTNRNAPKHHKTMWRWVIQGKQAAPILRQVTPYLRVKKKRAELALRFAATITGGQRVSDEHKRLRHYLAQQMSRMNSRGRPR